MKKVSKIGKKNKKEKVLREVEILGAEQYEHLRVDGRVETIQALIPLGLMFVQKELQREVEELAGERYARESGGKQWVRYGSNPGSVRLAGQRVAVKVPRVRSLGSQKEVGLESYQALKKQSGEVDERLLRRVLYGISCRNYESAAEAVPGSIGLSSSSVPRQFIEATRKQLKAFQERDLSREDFVALWVDGKAFTEDTMIVVLGLTMQGKKVPIGFVQAGTENTSVMEDLFRGLLERGLNVEAGLLVIIDGSKGIRAAVQRVFGKKALVQRCQWHKRENVVSYLPKGRQPSWRARLQKAYKKPTYREAKSALNQLLKELQAQNIHAAGSLEEGFEETLTLHRLGVYQKLGASLKTTNCIESVMSQVEARCSKVSHWKNSSQKHRWLASSLLDIEKRLRRIKGHKHLPLLREALQKELKIKTLKQVA